MDEAEHEPHTVTRREYTRWCAKALVFLIGFPLGLVAIVNGPFDDAIARDGAVIGAILYVAALPLLFKAFRVGRRSRIQGKPMEPWGLRGIWR